MSRAEPTNTGGEGDGWVKLDDCPFCGSIPHEGPYTDPKKRGSSWDGWRVFCGQCCFEIYDTTSAHRVEARAKWNRRVVAIQPHPSQQAGTEVSADDLARACAAVADGLVCEGPEHRLIHERDKYSLRRIATDSNLARAILAALKPVET